VEEEENILSWYSDFYAQLQEEFTPLSMFCVRESGERYIQKGCIHTISSALNLLNLRTWEAGWHSAIGLVLTSNGS
jgi:hypothetical protein